MESWEDFGKRVGMKRNAAKESRKVGKFQATFWYRGCHHQHLADLKNINHWIGETLYHLKTTRSFQWRILKKRVRSFTMLPLVRATSWPPIEDLLEQNSSRLRVAKYTSFVFFLLMRVSTTSSLRKKWKAALRPCCEIRFNFAIASQTWECDN